MERGETWEGERKGRQEKLRNRIGGENESGKKEINYAQSTVLLFHIFCTFGMVEGFHGDKLPAGAALGKEREAFGSLCKSGAGRISPAAAGQMS